MAIYNIGSVGSQYQKLSDIDWSSLQPGDVVRVHWKPEAYDERLLLDIQGTADNPIVIEGVPGPNGELPVLDANGATTPEQFSDFNITWRQNLGGSIYIGPKNSYPDPDEIPQHIVIRGFEITGAGQGNTIYDTDGNPHTHAGQAAIYVKGGDNITIENNHIHHNGAGVFSNSNHDYEVTENLVIKGNTFELNGVSGSYLYHHVYTEGVNTLIDGNTFLEKIGGDLGSLLKMRDVGIVISNNEFGSSPGHIIDLGDVQSDAMVALGFINPLIFTIATKFSVTPSMLRLATYFLAAIAWAKKPITALAVAPTGKHSSSTTTQSILPPTLEINGALEFCGHPVQSKHLT